MATTFPSVKQTFTDPSGTSLLTSPDHAALHTTMNDTVEAMQDAYGTTAGTNVLKDFAAGQFPIRHTGGTIQHLLTGGTINSLLGTTPTFVNPTLTGGTINSAILGTPTINVGSDATGDLYYRNAGAYTRLPIGANGQFLTTNGTAPSWGNTGITYASSGTLATGTTASASFVSVPGGTVLISPNRTVTVQAIASGRMYGNAAGNISLQLLINGTVQQLNFDVGVTAGEVNNGKPFAIVGQQSMGSGSGTVILQFKTSAGTMSIDPRIDVNYG